MSQLKRTILLTVIVFFLALMMLFPLYKISNKFVKKKLSSKKITLNTKYIIRENRTGPKKLSPSKKTNGTTIEFLKKISRDYPPNNLKVILLGLDGATLKVILPLVERNRLSFFASIAKDGTYGELRSIRPIKSPAIWTTVVTGKKRAEHGIDDFVTFSRGESRMVPVTRFQRRVKAIWNMLTDFNRKTVTVNWWVTTPPEPVNGCMVSDVLEFIFNPISAARNPRSYFYPPSDVGILTSIRPDLDAEQELVFNKIWNNVQPGNTKDETVNKGKEQLKEFIRSDLLVFHSSRKILKKYPFDLAAIYFQGIDVISHHFWNVGEKTTKDNKPPIPGGPVVSMYYEFIDGLLMELKSSLPPDISWLIVSDHGFTATRKEITRQYKINLLFEKMGLLVFKDKEKTNIDFNRTIIFDRRDNNLWENARVCSFNTVYKNSDGTTIFNKADFLETLCKTLANLNTDSGKKVFLSITRFENNETSQSSMAPDVVLSFNPALQGKDKVVINSKRVKISDFIVDTRSLPGSHHISGILFASGPCFRNGIKASGSVLDITPTLLHILGMPVAQDFQGKVIENILDPGLISWKINVISSYETIDNILPEKISRSIFEKDVINQLKGIGYLE